MNRYSGTNTLSTETLWLPVAARPITSQSWWIWISVIGTRAKMSPGCPSIRGAPSSIQVASSTPEANPHFPVMR